MVNENLFQLIINGYTLNIRPEDIRSWDVSIKGDIYPERFEIHLSGHVSPPTNPYDKSNWGNVVRIPEIEAPPSQITLRAHDS